MSSEPSQVARPWRAVVRTLVATALGLLPLLPEIANAAGIDDVPIVARSLVVSAAVTRVLALKSVNDLLDNTPGLQWLSADPYVGKHRKTKDSK